MAANGCGGSGSISGRDSDGFFIPPVPPDMAASVPDASVSFQPADVVLTKEVDLPGSLQGLVAGQNGCRALRTVAPNGPIRYELVHVGTDGKLSAPVTLPNSDRRSYNILRSLKNSVAVTYESTQGYLRQDGTHHGVYFVFADGATKDIGVYSEGAARPTDVLERGDKLYVLVSNGSLAPIKGKVVYPKSSVLVYDMNDLSRTPEKHALSLYNAGSMILKEGKEREVLEIHGAGDYVGNPLARGGIAFLDPDTFRDSFPSIDNIAGLGLSAAVLANGVVMVAGSTPTHSLSVVNTDRSLLSVELPLEVKFQITPLVTGQTYVPGLAAVGSTGVLMNVQQNGGTQTYLLGLDGTSKSVGNEIPSLAPVPPASFGQDEFCSGATDSAVDNLGNTSSKVLFWRAE